MKRRLGKIAITLMALTALVGVLSYVFLSKKDPQIFTSTQQSKANETFVSSPSNPSLSSSQTVASNSSGESESSSPVASPSNTQKQNKTAQSGTKTTAPAVSPSRRSIADILEGVDLSKDGERERVLTEMRKMEEAKKSEAERVAREKGWPIRVESSNGSIREIADLDEQGKPIYLITHNINAAISTAANLVQASPYSLNGLNLILGQWDGGSARSTHQEFGGRVTVKDGAASIDHATHVAGTMIASGVTTTAKGMAPSAKINSYDWTSDKTEMTAAAAVLNTDTNKILISNHSYGYVSGWVGVFGGSPYRTYEWYGAGTGTTGADSSFGLYNTYARDSDSLAYSAPCYLMFRSAGNDRYDNPSNGQAVGLSANATSVVNYDRTQHPAGDNSYRGGYETISYDALAKNVITIGSVSDAINGTNRSSSSANLSGFSSTGPTDDGRIKPDVVANGEDLYSTLNGSDTSYGSMSGTSMASPNAAGAAALVAQQYILSFGKGMRSSTLKGLLIHTADDRGNPGPDYQYGWGLINAQAAVDLIRDQKANTNKLRLIEGTIDNVTNRTISHRFLWDGTNPIRVTLAWIDPAGGAFTTADSRSPRLVNNLDLKIVRPDGVTNLPFVMPFVGNWSQSSMASNAIAGTNNVDNVEQVLIATPAGTGTFQAVVSYQGSLSNNLQAYSLLVSGASDTPAPPAAITVDTINPASGYARTFTLDVGGTQFTTNASLRLTRAGFSDVVATNLQFLNSSTLRGQATFPTNGTGGWNVTVSNSPAQTGTLSNGFTLLSSLAAENFEGAVSGWTSAYTNTGSSNGWNLSTNSYKSASKAYLATAPSSRSTAYLTSPSYAIPAGATNLQIRFWHSYNFQSNRDGGRLELSNDGGSTWFAMETTNTDETFSSLPYNGTISTSSSDFNLKKAWTGSSSGFVETAITINTPSKYAGRNLRIRWVLASNTGTSSVGWYIDDLVVLGSTPPANTPPTIISAASSSAVNTTSDGVVTWGLLSGDSISLSIRAGDDGGESTLNYTWSSDAPAGPDAPFFSPNGTNAAKDTTVYFSKLGDYALTVYIRDVAGLETSSTVHVRVLPVASAVAVFPGSASLAYGKTQAFTAILQDQFGNPMDSQPANWNWSVNGGGTVTSGGLFTATSVGGPFTLGVEAGGFFDTADITVVKASQTITFSTAGFAQVGDTRFLSASSSSGLPTAIEMMPASLASLSGNTLSFLSAGTLTITARQSGNENFLAAPEISAIVSISNPTYTSLFNTTSPGSDADGDGVPALVEYALGGGTNSNDQNLLPQMNLSNSSLSISAVIRTNDTNLLVYP
ncbi:MAG: hypothetical protein EB056_04570, partial [Verrucomicrobia bacterium]|nr:hypothetical protein [Verrucomicrobiota bacterium]